MQPTTEKLATALQTIPGIPAGMIQRARDGYYDDYKSDLTFPQRALVEDLTKTGIPEAAKFIDRVVAGEFDGTREEAMQWANSPEGQEAFNELIGKHPE